MPHPDTDTVADGARPRHGVDLPRQIEHVQRHGVARQQAPFEGRELRCLEAQASVSADERCTSSSSRCNF